MFSYDCLFQENKKAFENTKHLLIKCNSQLTSSQYSKKDYVSNVALLYACANASQLIENMLLLYDCIYLYLRL